MYGVSSIIITPTVLSLLGVTAVCLRFYVRLRLTPTFVGLDDWLIAFSCLLVLGQTSCQITSAVIGDLGRDGKPAIQWRSAHQAKINSAAIILEKFTYTFIKLSVLFFYRRIFFQRKSFRIANSILIVLVTLWGLIFFLDEVIITYDKAYIHRFAESQRWSLFWFGITDVLGDIAILTLPYPFIRKLQMGRRAKVGLTVVFLLGTLSLIFGVVRLFFVVRMFITYFESPKSHINGPNTPPTFWTTAEVTIGLLAACLPPLKPLIQRVPSPRKVYDFLRNVLVSRLSGRSNAPKRLSSLDNIPRTDGSNEGKMKIVKTVEFQMMDVDIGMRVEDAGFSRAV